MKKFIASLAIVATFVSCTDTSSNPAPKPAVDTAKKMVDTAKKMVDTTKKAVDTTKKATVPVTPAKPAATDTTKKVPAKK